MIRMLLDFNQVINRIRRILKDNTNEYVCHVYSYVTGDKIEYIGDEMYEVKK